MGFRTGAYATVWEVTPEREFSTKLRITISRKNKNTDEYEQDFSGYVTASGTGAAKKAAQLKERDRIRLGDVDVTNTYNKEKNTTYTNYKIFNFATADDPKFNLSAKEFVASLNDGNQQTASAPAAKPGSKPAEPAPAVDDVPW